MDPILEVLEKLLSISDNQKGSNKVLIFKQFLTKVNKKVATDEFLEALFSCSGNSDRIDVVKEHFNWISFDTAVRDKYQKNNEISSTFRNLGNSVLQKKCYVDAVRSYNMALAFAVPGEAEIGLAYANRSIALHSMGLIEEALQDIDLALGNHYSRISKLEGRKYRFLAHLAKRSKDKDNTFEHQLKLELSVRNSFCKNLFTLKRPNPLSSALQDSIDITYNSSHGRCLVANRDVYIGDTVLVEVPFVAVLDKALNWDLDHCHYCLKKNLRCIPCTKCVFTLYCNDKCRSEAEEKYHRYECPCLPELHCILKDDLSKNFYLVFKLICMMGPNKLFKMYTEHKQQGNNESLWESEENNNSVKGADPVTLVYESGSYRAIHNLVSTINPKEGYYFILLSLILSRTLDFNSDFFDSTNITTGMTSSSDYEKPEFRDYVAKLILHHFEAFRRNAYGLREASEMDGVTLRTYMESAPKEVDYGLEEFAVGIYGTASLINHSCDPNVLRFTGKTFGTMAIIAIKQLKKGEEILITYGPAYGSFEECDTSRIKRQAVLNLSYDFTCDCIACKNDWPGILDLSMTKAAICCSFCAAHFPHDQKASSQFMKSKLSKRYKCRSCGREHNKQSIQKEYDRHVKALEVCQKLVLRNSPLTAISSLKAALQFFETNTIPPNYYAVLGPKLYRDAVCLIMLFSNLDII